MGKALDFLRALFGTARTALDQLSRAVPDYWDGMAVKAARLALAALFLFAGALLLQLAVLLLARQRPLRRILACAGTLAAVLALGAWACRPVPVAQAPVQSASLVLVAEDGAEQAVRLTAAQQKALAALLEGAQCRPSALAALPAAEGAVYRVAYETKDGAAFVLAARGVCVRYTTEEKGLLYPVLAGDALYEALAGI